MPDVEPALTARQRRRAREVAFRLLFQADQGPTEFDQVIAAEREETDLPADHYDWAAELARGAWTTRRVNDQLLDSLAAGWAVARMGSAERSILRLAAYEIRERTDIPHGVSVNEAVELAKRYAEAEAPRFINGILGTLVREHGRREPAPEGDG